MGRTRGWLAAAAALLMVTASGCDWSQIGSGPGNGRYHAGESTLTAANVGSLRETWGHTSRFDQFSEPVVVGNRLYSTKMTMASDGSTLTFSVEATNVTTGTVLWDKVLVPTAPYGSSMGMLDVVHFDGALWVSYWTPTSGPGCVGTLARLDPATGAVLSSQDTERLSSYVVGDGSVVAHLTGCTNPQSLVVRDHNTRAVQWSYTFPDGDVPTEPTLAYGKIFVAAGANLYAFDAAGCGSFSCSPLWTRPAAGGNFDERATAGANDVYLRNGNKLEIYAAATGNLKWTVPAPAGGSVIGFAVTSELLYVNMTSPAGDQLVVHRADGCGVSACPEQWTVPFPSGSLSSVPPAAGGGVVYLAAGSDLVAVGAEECGASVCGELRRLTVSYGGTARGVTQSSGHVFTRHNSGELLHGFGL